MDGENGFVRSKFGDLILLTETKMTYTNSTNIFNFIAHDVLQYALSPFLTADDRANFNAVLEPTERVAKKFPANFAERHAVRIAYGRQKFHAERLNEVGAEIGELAACSVYNDFVKRIGDYADFFLNPISRPLFVYRTKVDNKTRVIDELASKLDDDHSFAPFMTTAVRAKILKAIDLIDSLVPEKHVHIPRS